MALRFWSEHRDIADAMTWRIEIFDSTFEGEEYEFVIEQQSCSVQWRADGSESVLPPILGSTCEFTMMVEDATHEQLITDIAGAKEGRFTVVLYRNSVLYWAGVINSPEINFDDWDFPYPFTISAVDGLALLRNYPYSQGGRRWEDKYEDVTNLVGIVGRCLKKLPHIVTHFDGAEKFIVTAINWYSSDHADPAGATDDPFFYTYLDNRGFAQGQSSGAAKFATCYDAIAAILTAFGAQISLKSGSFIIEQPEHRAFTIGTNQNYSRYYDYDLTAPTANTLDDEQAIGNDETIKKLRGGTYSFLPALQAARVKQTLNGLQNLIPAFQVGSANPTTGYAVGTVFGNGLSTYIRFTATVEYTLSGDALLDNAPYLALFKLYIELGGKTPLRGSTFVGAESWTYDPLAWQGDLSGLIDFVASINAPVAGESTTGQATINLLFPTPYDFTQGDLVVDFDFDALYFTGVAVSGGDYAIEWVLKDSYLDIITALTPFVAKAVTYEVTGDADNTQVEEIKTSVGDKDSPIMNQWSGLLYFDSPNYFYTTQWGNRNGTRNRTIAQLLAQRVLSAHYFPRKILRGATAGVAFVVETPIEERGERFFLRNGTYNTTRDEMSGEWLKLAYTAAEFGYTDAEYDTGNYEATTPGGGTSGGGTPIDNGGGGSPGGVPDGNGIYSGSGMATNVTVTIDGVLSFESDGADDAFQVDMEGGGAYIDSTTAQLTFNDGGNVHSVGLTASGVLINAPSATADNVFIRAAGALVKLQDIGGNVQIGGGTTESEARFMEASGNGTNYAAVKAPSTLAANVSLVLPPTSGTANQLLGQNSGATGTEYKTLNGTTNQVTVTHGANSITLALPQNLHTGATPTFSDLTLTDDLFVTDDVTLNGTSNRMTFSGSASGDIWLLAPSNTIRMDGNASLTVGDGTGNAQTQVSGLGGVLDAVMSSGSSYFLIQSLGASSSTVGDDQARIRLYKNDGAALSNGHVLGVIDFMSRGSTAVAESGARITAFADGADWTGSSNPTKLEIAVVPSGSDALSVAVTIRETKNTEFAGNVELTTTGAKVKISTGSNASVGTATLSSGTVTVNTTAVATASIIFLTYNTPSGTTGQLSAPSASIINGTSFVINSSSIGDNSTVNWWIIN